MIDFEYIMSEFPIISTEDLCNCTKYVLSIYHLLLLIIAIPLHILLLIFET